MRRTVVAAAAAALLISLAPAPPASVAAEPPGPPGPDDGLVQRLDPDRVSYAESGWVRFLGGSRKDPLQEGGSSPDALAAASGFLGTYGSLFGLTDPAAELRARPADPAAGRVTSVRFDQLHQGVPVLAGELAVVVDATGAVLAVNGEISAGLELDVQPALGAGEAAEQAIAAVAKADGLPAAGLAAQAPSLWVYDPALLSGPAAPFARLVWRTKVVSADRSSVHDLVLVDAQKGGIALRFRDRDASPAAIPGQGVDGSAPPSLVIAEKSRHVCDRNNVRSDNPCASPYTRVEGQVPTGIADVDAAYDFLGDTWDFYYSRYNRVGIDDSSSNLYAVVRYCPASASEGCPYGNAFWSSDARQMLFGAGFVVDDVTAHEMTHGVTDAESALFYYYQSGAINEAMSDVFGEFIDQVNGRGNDAAGVKWLLGEDMAIGAVRSMSNPPTYGQPDRMQSSLYYSGAADGGGVHTNSGVANKAAYLLTDGGTFNGRTVGSIGLEKTARIFYHANKDLLTSGSDYLDLHNVLQQSCTDLVGSNGITSSDCTQVGQAVAAVEMNLQPTTGAAVADVPVCAAGSTATTLYSQGFEGTVNDWSTNSTTGIWTIVTGYAHSGTKSLYGWDADTTSDTHAYMVSGVTLPAGETHLRFDHAWEFEHDLLDEFDGGVLEYSIDGFTWLDAGSLITDGAGYNGTIPGAYGNPLGGRPAFVAASHGYTSTRLHLSSLAGATIRFRFRIGTDTNTGSLGWLIDDFRVYSCSTSATVPGAPTGVTAVAGNAEATVSWTAPASNGGSAITSYTATASPGGQTCTWTTGPLSCTVTGLTNDTSYTFTVRAQNAAGLGAASAPSNAVTPSGAPTVPGAPTGVTAVAGDASALVSWTPPVSDGGAAITQYTVTSSPDALTCSTSGLSCTVAGLTNWTPYSFTVVAANGVGSGPASDPSAPVTPTAPPPAPTAKITTQPTWQAVTSVTVRWTGTDATTYDVRYKRAAWNGSFGAEVAWKTGTSALSASLKVAAGSTYCFRAMARGPGGSSAWTAWTCTAIPLDDRSLTRTGSWTASTGSAYYRSTYVRSSVASSKLTRTGVVAKRIALVATTCPTCGSVRVYWGSTLLKTISLTSRTTVYRKLITVTTFTSTRSGTLSIKVYSSGKKVLIDGVAISRV